MIKKKHFLLGSLLGLVLFFAYIFTLPDTKLYIYFCNVGQGDAAYIRTPSNQDILIDGGPDDKVLDCLGRHMPFYDRTIDVVMLSHPQKDHMQGLISVLNRFKINYMVIGPEGNDTEGYKKLVETIKKKNIPVKNLYQGDEFNFGKVKFSVLWPERKWAASRFSSSLSDLSHLGNLNVLGLSTDTNLNQFSYYLYLNYGSFDALFTGDGDSGIQPEIITSVSIPEVEVLKYPHHGSKTGLSTPLIDLLKPKLAIISVGKNSYGHPTKEALNLLKTRSVKIDRTDKKGDIEVFSDGNSWGEAN